jgi:oligopeptide transport system ATP-binding protein
MLQAEVLPAAENLLEVVGLHKHFFGSSLLGIGGKKPVRAVDGVDLAVRRGETFGLVGESGCGKSTLARLMVGLLRPTSGEVLLGGETLAAAARRERELRRRVQIIFQDPYSSLNPSFSVRTILKESYRLRGVKDPAREEGDLTELLEKVGLRRATLDQYPHQLSGGMRQRVVIARALAPGPELVVADEPVSALDVSVQSQVLNLLIDLQQELALTYVFISHDLNVIRYICDRVAIMYLGRVVEAGPVEEVLSSPRHPYTEGLLSGLPTLSRRERSGKRILGGDLPSPLQIPSGCRFHPRCAYASELCRQREPSLEAVGEGREVSCHDPVAP